MMPFKRNGTVAVAVLLLWLLGCRLASSILPTTPTPLIYVDTFFSGHSFVDSNHNGELDPTDAPLENARFTVGAFGATTDESGYAFVIIPGDWAEPVTARMLPPQGSSYTLIGPAQVILQSGGQTSADFLFTTQENPSGSPSGKPKPGSVEIDLTYCTTADGEDLKMDIYYPGRMDKPSPAVVYVHGGGWIAGDKTEGAGLLFAPLLQKQGYLVAAINYRLAPADPFPAPIEDVKCAIRHLRVNADRYHLAPDRIGVVGGSAGGHLAALLGLADASAGWDSGQYGEYSSRVKAVVDLFGPADLTQLFTPQRQAGAKEIFGVSGPDDPLLRNYSPVTYITPDDPPFLILQGLEDKTVPPSQSQLLYERLSGAGVTAHLVMIKNAGHGFQPVGGQPDPSIQRLALMVLEFFDRYLK